MAGVRKVQILQGDVMDRLRDLDDESINCVVTSPPYWGMRDYGAAGQIGLEETIDDHVDRMVEVFGEVKRVLRSDGVLWMNYGDSYHSNQGKGWLGQEASMSDAERNTSGHVRSGIPPKNLLGLPWRVALALQSDGWIIRSDVIWHKPNPAPESCRDRPTRAHEYLFLITKSPQYAYDIDAIREKTGREVSESEWKNADGRSAPSGDLTEGVNKGFGSRKSRFVHPNGANVRSVWTIPTEALPDAHFATFPQKLVLRCILAGCPKGGTVLDPFSGSGTTALVAAKNDRDGIGIELNPEYVAISERRLGGDMWIDLQIDNKENKDEDHGH